MKYVIQDSFSFDDGIDLYTGLSKNGRGGSELMYRALMGRLTETAKERFQFISSRVRKIDPNKKAILILNDTCDDPESQHLKDPNSRARFAQLVFVSHYQFNTYNLKLGVPYTGSVVYRNAILPIGNHSKPDSDKQLNIIYHTTPHRGLELLVPIFIELCNHHPHLHLDVYSSFELYGWKDRDKPYEQLFNRCRTHPNITYHGAVDNDEIRQSLQKAHIFAYPSIWPETSCIAAIEAMSAGCAVIAPDFAALPETLSNYGYIYRWSEDPKQHLMRFGQVLNTIITNLKHEQIQTNLRFQKSYADNAFSWDRRMREWEMLLANL